MKEQPKGPRVSLPAIEKKYGKPIQEWMTILSSAQPATHSELVSLLKTQHGVGHGHATALVHSLTNLASPPSPG